MEDFLYRSAFVITLVLAAYGIVETVVPLLDFEVSVFIKIISGMVITFVLYGVFKGVVDA